jgi:hypothetical protein
MTGGPQPPESNDRDLPTRYITGASAIALTGGIGIGVQETLTGHNPLGYTFAAFLVLMGFGMRRAANALIRK